MNCPHPAEHIRSLDQHPVLRGWLWCELCGAVKTDELAAWQLPASHEVLVAAMIAQECTSPEPPDIPFWKERLQSLDKLCTALRFTLKPWTKEQP